MNKLFCITALVAFLATTGCKGHGERAKERLAKATAKAKKEAEAPPPAPPPPPPPPPVVTPESGAVAVGELLPPFHTSESISPDKEVAERIVALAYKPANRHTVKMLTEKGAVGVDAVTQGLWHGNSRVRASSARLVAKLKFDAKKVAPLFNRILLMDPKPEPRAATASVLVDLKLKACGEALTKVLAGDKDESARASAAWALGKMNHRPAIAALEKALTDPATWVRIRSATALGRLKSRKSIPALKRALKDPNGEVRKSAGRALKKIR